MKDKPAIFIDFKKNRIRVHKSTLQAIGMPEHVLLLVNPDKEVLAICKSDVNDPRAHRIPWSTSLNKQTVELYSKPLLNSLHEVCSDWREKHSLRLYGELFPAEGMAWFSMIDMFPIGTAKE